MRYLKPSVEIVDFLALERIAVYGRRSIEEDDDVEIGDRPGLNESVVEWPINNR